MLKMIIPCEHCHKDVEKRFFTNEEAIKFLENTKDCTMLYASCFDRVVASAES